MKKHLCVVAFLATLSSAFAIPTFVLPEQINIEPGQSVTVTLEATNLADYMSPMGPGIQNMNVFLSCDSPLVLSNLDLIGEGLLFSTNYYYVYEDSPSDQLLIGGVETENGPYTESGSVARFTITAPLDTQAGLYGLSTIAVSIQLRPSNFGDNGEAIQANAKVKVVPEPASALLLLAGLPLIRRRHA
ncbi:MAG: hypothetical protein FWC56_01890 [Phycisphaerae bacterium]|nr:hypothetical protein [Phycisphaerae bacterium]